MSVSRSRHRARHAGFTLIELLVVVAIIALLISILLPSLSRAREQSKQLLCNTNLRTIGQAAAIYRDENDEWGIRGIAGFGGGDNIPEYHIFATSILPYVGSPYDGPMGPRDLFRAGVIPNNPLPGILRSTDVYQCPNHPEPLNPLDYVASAFPVQYTQASIDWDVAGGGQAGDRYEGVPGNSGVTYRAEYRMTEFEAVVAPSRITLATESHVSLTGAGATLRFYHFFLTSQLPFGAFPRTASDQRHPGGINLLFFDGHAETKPLEQVDVGWPNSLGLRLRYFSIPPEQYF